jgi:hypothetical protein
MSNHNIPQFEFVIDRARGERKIDREDEIFSELITLFTEHFRKRYPAPVAQRAVHAKSHGCLKGSFEVIAHGDSQLTAGIFRKPGTYEAIARFSNGDGPAGPDTDKIVSVGLGVKVLGITTPKNLPTQTEDSQDFLLINQPKFIVSDIRGFQRIIEAREGGILKKAKAFFHHWRGIRFRRSASPKDNPLNTSYWGVTPFQLGGTTIKYLMKPCEPEPAKMPERLTADYLRTMIAERIAAKPAAFDFFLQKRLLDGHEEANMPIEDNAVAWSETASVPVRVGRLRIPAQKPGELVPEETCENLVFSPWNTTADFRPMSSLNRARKVIYEFSSRRRHEINRVGGSVAPNG